MELLIEKLYKKLSETKLLQDFSQVELSNFVTAGQVLEITPNTMLLTEGEDSNSLIVILDGEAEVLKGNLERNPHLIAKIGKGAVIGEMGLLLNIPRTSSVRSLTYCRLFVINREAFLAILDRDNSTGFKLCLPIAKTLAERLQTVTEDLVKILNQNDALLELIDNIKEQYSRNNQVTIESALFEKAEALKVSQIKIKEKLSISIDEVKKARQVEEITTTPFFQRIRKKVKSLKNTNQKSNFYQGNES